MGWKYIKRFCENDPKKIGQGMYFYPELKIMKKQKHCMATILEQYRYKNGFPQITFSPDVIDLEEREAVIITRDDLKTLMANF